MQTLSIGQVARRAGLRASAIRYYEDVGVLPAAPRAAGRRRYDRGVLRQLEALRFAKDAGFTLKEIRLLLHGFEASTPFSARWRILARSKRRELDRRAARLRASRRALARGSRCRCAGVEDCAMLADAP